MIKVNIKSEKDIDNNHDYNGKVIRVTEKNSQYNQLKDVKYILIKTDTPGLYIVVRQDDNRPIADISKLSTVRHEHIQRGLERGIIEIVN